MIYITGDTHGDFAKLENCPAGAGDSLIICGDFGGIWDGGERDNASFKLLDRLPYTVLFVDGNHENFDLLGAYPVTVWNGGRVRQISKNVIHLMRGQIYDIEGIRIFAMGGGACHDVWGGIYEQDDPDLEAIGVRLKAENKPYRINHVSWWADEMPSDEEYEEAERNLDRAGRKVDCIVTHCAPTHIQDAYSPFPFEKDRLTEYFSELEQNCSFRHWFFGHYHSDRRYDDRFVMYFDRIDALNDYFK